MIVPSIASGGIGPVCHYTARELSLLDSWDVSLVALHDNSPGTHDTDAHLNTVYLNLKENHCRRFQEWLQQNPQDVLITNNVSLIEDLFPYFPRDTIHIYQVHDSMRRYRASAVRYSQHIDAVTCVGRHVLPYMEAELERVGFKGLTRAIHNGAIFPPAVAREVRSTPLKLLFIGRMDPLKGIFDLPIILRKLEQMKVPVELHIVGGEHTRLASRLKQCSSNVIWHGKVPHAECYDIAANADIFLMLSRQEPFGMVTIEAMSMGCVPIAYDMPSGNVEIIRSPEDGFLVPLGSTSECAKVICTLHENRELLLKRAQTASDRARSAFSAEKTASALSDLIKATQDNRNQYTPERLAGSPTVEVVENHKVNWFHKLPASWRACFRELICGFPRLAHFIFKRL